MSDKHRATRWGAALWAVRHLGDRRVTIVLAVIGLACWYPEWKPDSAIPPPPGSSVLALGLAAGSLVIALWDRCEAPAARLASLTERVDWLLNEFTALVSAGDPVGMTRFDAAVAEMRNLSGELDPLRVYIVVVDGGEARAFEAAEENKETLFRLAFFVHAVDLSGARKAFPAPQGL